MNNKTIIEFSFNIIWRIMEITEGVIRQGCFLNLHNSSDDTQPHSIILIANDPYVCVRQRSEFHHQALFWGSKIAKFCIYEFPRQKSWKEYFHPKSANAQSFAYKQNLLVWRNHA